MFNKAYFLLRDGITLQQYKIIKNFNNINLLTS